MKKKCLYCEKEFEVSKNNPTTHKFCCLSCRNKYVCREKNQLIGIEKKCEVCGKYYIPHLGYEKIQKFCSEYCKNKQAAITHKEKYGLDEVNKQQRENRERRMLDEDYAKREKDYKKTPNQKFKQYIKGAEKRNIDFNLTFEQFLTFWNKPCHYCGDNIEGVGIDRYDNSIGYELDNCVPCCFTCNKMKHSSSPSDFFSHIQKIYKHTAGVKPADSSKIA